MRREREEVPFSVITFLFGAQWLWFGNDCSTAVADDAEVSGVT